MSSISLYHVCVKYEGLDLDVFPFYFISLFFKRQSFTYSFQRFTNLFVCDRKSESSSLHML